MTERFDPLTWGLRSPILVGVDEATPIYDQLVAEREPKGRTYERDILDYDAWHDEVSRETLPRGWMGCYG